MKIAHVADSHWGLNYPGPNPAARFEDITCTMDWVADRIIEERCELVLFAGDAFKDARVFIDRATIEIAAFTRWLRRLTQAGVQVVVISGTPSHDAVSAYKLIAEMKIQYVEVFTEPGIARFPGFSVCCLPGLNRSNFATEDDLRGMPPHEVHQKMTEWLSNEAELLHSQCSDGPVILMSHLTYDLADTGFEDVLMQNEPILTDETARKFDLVALGHIHRPQKAGGNVFYSGAPERHNFGDEHTVPGFYIHEFTRERGCYASSRFIETPARRFVTLRWSELELTAWLDGQLDTFEVADAMVRVQYTCGEATQKRFDRRALEKALYDAGAYHVHEIKADVERTDRTRDAEVTEALGPLPALGKWAAQQGINENETKVLQGMTAALLGEVLA